MKILKYYLAKTIDENELRLVSDFWLNRKVHLDEVEDIDEFIRQCETECKNFKKAGPHRKSDWEGGWSGSGITNEYAEFPNIPYYFKKNTHVRISNKVYHDISGLTELIVLRSLQDIAFSFPLLQKAKSVIEYGCGTGHNLSYLNKKLKHTLFGADWAESAVKNLTENKILPKDKTFCVDYFNKNSFSAPSQDFIAFTNASLEQAGSNYPMFMEYLFSNKACKGAIHIEPISDLIKSTHQLNRASISYAKKRGYLKNFFKFMKKSGKKIIHAKDYELGSKFISGYQIMVWEQ